MNFIFKSLHEIQYKHYDLVLNSFISMKDPGKPLEANISNDADTSVIVFILSESVTA